MSSRPLGVGLVARRWPNSRLLLLIYSVTKSQSDVFQERGGVTEKHQNDAVKDKIDL